LLLSLTAMQHKQLSDYFFKIEINIRAEGNDKCWPAGLKEMQPLTL
jgi:hypothetical protein